MMKTQTQNLALVHGWAMETNQPADAIANLLKIPARLGMIDADLSSLPAGLADYERYVAGKGYALVGNPKNVEANGRRMDSRVRALLRRFWSAYDGSGENCLVAQVRWDELIALIANLEGQPGSGSKWNFGRHRTLMMLRSRANCPPEDLTQAVIDQIGRAISSGKRKSLRKAVSFINELIRLDNEIPGLRGYLPLEKLMPPAGSSRARPIDWQELPDIFRTSFDLAADACLSDDEDAADRFLQRIEAGEDPETVMAEADLQASMSRASLNKPTAARGHYRNGIIWLTRAWEDHGGDIKELTNIRQLLTKTVIENAITDQISRSTSACDLKDPIASTTLKNRLSALKTLAARGLDDKAIVATVTLLQVKHYDKPRKIKKMNKGDGIFMEVDRLFDMLRQKPELANIWCNAPRRIADAARVSITKARAQKSEARELTALRQFAGAVAYALQMSRPMRTACLRNARLRTSGAVHSNLLRTSPGERLFTFRFAPWEIKNNRWVNVDVVGDDADILQNWIENWRPRLIELQDLDPNNPYLFPGRATPARDEGDPMDLPVGSYSPSAFLELWEDASAILGVQETPHRMRHIVALLILLNKPGNYALVASVLGNEEATSRRHYGRDDGQDAAREIRAALLKQHPTFFSQLKKRHTHAH
jgi:integrase